MPHGWRANRWSNESRRGLRFGWRWLTARLRARPDYIVIGAGKCGTTSLQRYLSEHPEVRPAIAKELHFFDHNHQLGELWYRAHFPRDEPGRSWVTGEATPYYLCHPSVPRLVARSLPDVRLIVLVRDPIDRALSQYHMVHDEYGVEPLSFEQALVAEDGRLAGEVESLERDQSYFSFSHLFYSYKERGKYADQLMRWYAYFRREQVLVIRSEDLFQDTATQFARVLDFLELPQWAPTAFWAHNAGLHDGMAPETRAHLEEYFGPHNERLAELLKCSPLWGG